jgi:hypothetical protein
MNKIEICKRNSKKNLQAEKTIDTELYFFDESRFGTHSKLGYGWFPKGSRTAVNIKLGYKNFYVYSMTHSNNGDHFSLILPFVNTQCMNVFLKEMSEYLGDKKIILVMDQAPWHKSEALIIPQNIRIIHLPPYSPELNPVERLWQYIKSHTIKNRIYDNLGELEQAICDFIKNLNSSTVKSICSISY